MVRKQQLFLDNCQSFFLLGFAHFSKSARPTPDMIYTSSTRTGRRETYVIRHAPPRTFTMAYVVVAVRLAQHYVHQERRQDPTPHHTRAGSQYIPHGVSDAAFARAGHARQAAARAAWPAWLKTLLDCYKRRTRYSREMQDKVARVLLACELLPGLLDFHAWKRVMAPQVGELIKDENRSGSIVGRDGVWTSPFVVVCI